jgi:hypothetical protein
MKHVRLFEDFNQSSKKTKIELYLEGSNPDVNYSCTAVGVGYNPREAAMYCIMAAVTFILSGDSAPVPQDLNNFEEVVEDFILKDELEKSLDLLERGEVLKDDLGYAFLSGSDWVKAEAKVEQALPGASIGGFILDPFEEETY